MFLRCISLSLCALLVGAGSFLLNPSFEDTAAGLPSSWALYADVSVASNALPHSGALGVSVSSTNSSSYGILYQRCSLPPSAPGTVFQVSAWARGGAGYIALEYLDAQGRKVAVNSSPFPATGSLWVQRTVALPLPPPSGLTLSAVLGAVAGATVLYDDASADLVQRPVYAFDLARPLAAEFEGFGVNAWASMAEGLKYLRPLGLRWVRTTQDGDSAQQLQAMHALTQSLGIRQVYLLWSAPERFTAGGMLVDVAGFAAYWVGEVARLDSLGVRPDAIDLMNEPDSGGAWSTGIAPGNYSALVALTRALLDAAGYPSVAIFGPGLVVLSSEPQWVGALSAAAAAALGRFVSHAYDDGPGLPGAATMAAHFPAFASAVRAVAPPAAAPAPLLVTEYATHNPSYLGYTYPNPDSTPAGAYSLADSLPYAVRVAENTLALLNSGASGLLYWCAQDMGGKSWGYVSQAGRLKPVYWALLNLYPRLALGGRMLQPPAMAQHSDVTVGVYAQPRSSRGSAGSAALLLALSNAGAIEESVTLQLAGCSPGALRVLNATACVGVSLGNPSKGEYDQAALVDAAGQVSTGSEQGVCTVTLTLPALSTLAVDVQV